MRTMVANALASLTNRNKKQETSEAEVELVPASQDPPLDEFMSRHIDKIFLRKNGLIFTIRTEKSERTPIQLRNLEISFPMDEVISEKDMLQGISRRVPHTVSPEATREFKNDTWGEWIKSPPPQMAGFILERKNRTRTALKSPAKFYSFE
ncbi:MAG: hypothetical protein L7V87_04725 [Verrucomicrobiales bacterium]|nr:hypothetical protein [Verrucomicrobiales bacterium]